MTVASFEARSARGMRGHVARGCSLLLAAFCVGLSACGGSTPQPQSSAPAEKPLLTIAARPASSAAEGKAAAAPLGIVAKRDKCLTSRRNEFILSCVQEAYKLTSEAPEGDYELSFTSAYYSVDDGDYSAWVDGTWNDGKVAGNELSFDVGGTFMLREAPKRTSVLRVEGNDLRGEVRVRIVRSGERLSVFADDRPVMSRKVPRSGREVGFLSRNGTPRITNLVLQSLSRAASAEFAAMADLPSTTLPTAKAPEPAPTAETKTGTCDAKRLDWKNREYPSSKLAAKPFKLTNGWYKFNVKKVDPATNFGNEEMGDAYSLTETEFGDFNDDGIVDAMVGFSKTDFGVFHGNRPAPSLPWVGYVYQISAACEPELAGSFSAQADEFTRARDGKLVLLLSNKAGAKRRELRIDAGGLKLVSEGQIDQPTYKGYLAPEAKCDEARVRAGLPSDPKQQPSYSGAPNSIRVTDPCVAPRLTAVLGKRTAAFARNDTTSSGNLKANGPYLIGTGCRAHVCMGYQSAFAIDTKTWAVHAAIIELGKVEWIGAGTPPDELKSVVEGIRQNSLQR